MDLVGNGKDRFSFRMFPLAEINDLITVIEIVLDDVLGLEDIDAGRIDIAQAFGCGFVLDLIGDTMSCKDDDAFIDIIQQFFLALEGIIQSDDPQ